MFFAKFKLYLFSQKRNFCLVICRKEGNKLCQLSGRMLLLASIPLHTLVSSPAPLPSLSLLLLRDSFGGTFAKWLDACLEYIFMFAKKAMRARAKLFEQGRAFAPSTSSSTSCLPACPTHLIRSSLRVHLYILSVWHSPSQIYGKLLANEHRMRHFVFSKI